MHLQIYSGLRLIFAILRSFRVVSVQRSLPSNIVYIYPIGQKKVTLGLLFRSKNDENRACVAKIYFGSAEHLNLR